MNERSEQMQQTSSSKRRESRNSGKDPPPLSHEGAQLLKRVEEGVIRMLAEKKIDTNVYSEADEGDAGRPKKENEQNVKNRAREIRFNAHIQRYVIVSHHQGLNNDTYLCTGLRLRRMHG